MNHPLRKIFRTSTLAIACAFLAGCGSAQNNDSSATDNTDAAAGSEAVAAAPISDERSTNLDSTHTLAGDVLPDGSFVVVSGPNAQRLVEAGATLVDVRTPEEFAEGHLEGAVNIPHTEISPERLRDAGVDEAAVLYCGTGRRAGLAFNALRQQGHTAMVSMGAMSNWPESAGADAGTGADVNGETGSETDANSDQEEDGASTDATSAPAE